MTRKILDRAEEEDKFQRFLIIKEDILDDFIEEAEAHGYEFDFSEESLDKLEQYYLKRESELNADAKKKGSFIEAAACYLGDTLKKVYGGKWTLAIDDPQNLYYGMPVITGHSKYDVEFCPHDTFRIYTTRKKQGFLRRVIQNDVNPVELDLTPEE